MNEDKVYEGYPLVLAGIDCGRSSDWMWIVRYHVPRKGVSSINQLSDITLREVLFASDVIKTEIPNKLKEYYVNFGLIDNEPDIEKSSRLCENTVLEMADQKTGQLEEFKLSYVIDGGVEYKCWKIRNEKFLKQVQQNFLIEYEDGYPLYRLPREWSLYRKNKTERSPFKHLTSVEYNPETGKWDRSKDKIDDLYYSAMFCEAAFYIYMNKQLRSMSY